MALAYCFKIHEPAGNIKHVWQLLGTSKALLKLKVVCNASDRMVGEVTDGFQGLVAHSLSTDKASIQDILGSAGINFSEVEALDEAFQNVPDIFQGLEMAYKQEKYFRENFNLVVSLLHNINDLCVYTLGNASGGIEIISITTRFSVSVC